jgi:hypothetical protein
LILRKKGDIQECASRGCGRVNEKKGRDDYPTHKKCLIMSLHHLENLYPEQAQWISSCEKLRKAVTMSELVWSALQIGLLFVRLALEQELDSRD